MIDLSIILVNWNTRELLLSCLKSIARYPPSRSYEVWVVDNNSADQSVEAVRALYSEMIAGTPGAVHVIANSENVGFAAANNQAIAACSGRKILLLNSDTEVLPGALEGMCVHLDAHPEAGAVGCRLLNRDGSTQRSAWRGYPGLQSALIEGLYLWRFFPQLVVGNEVALGEYQVPVQVDHLLGACIMVTRAVLEQVGPLDASYYLFLEETDWCRRIAEAGWCITYLPQYRIIHFGQQSMRQIPARTLPIFYASLCRFVRKHGGSLATLQLIILKMIIAVSVVLRMGLWAVRLGSQRALSLRMLGGYGSVLRQLPTF